VEVEDQVVEEGLDVGGAQLCRVFPIPGESGTKAEKAAYPVVIGLDGVGR
jgi:hypothetical protein